MAITSEIIGKLGGADVEVIPVSGTNSGSSGTSVILHTVVVPDGETWLVALHGDLRSGNGGGMFAAQLVIGTTEMSTKAENGIRGLAHVGTGTIDVKLRRNTGSGSDSFTGHVYTVKL